MRQQDYKERAQLALIVKLHDEEGTSFEAIYLHFFHSGVRTSKRKVWGFDRVWRAYWAAKKTAEGSPKAETEIDTP